MDLDTYKEARALLRRGGVAEVRSMLAPLEAQGSQDAKVSFLLGVCDFRGSNFEAAEAHFRVASSLDGLFADARYYIGLCLDRRGRGPEARIEYMSVLAIEPNHASANKKLGTGLPDRPAPDRAMATPAAPRAAPPAKPPATEPSAASRLAEDGLAKGIYTEQKPPFVYWLQLIFVFLFTFVLAGGVGGAACAVIAGAVIGMPEGPSAVVAVIGAVLIGGGFGIASAGTIRKFK
jgi:tetratricopeptide (TPR) repeat protein